MSSCIGIIRSLLSQQEFRIPHYPLIHTRYSDVSVAGESILLGSGPELLQTLRVRVQCIENAQYSHSSQTFSNLPDGPSAVPASRLPPTARLRLASVAVIVTVSHPRTLIQTTTTRSSLSQNAGGPALAPRLGLLKVRDTNGTLLKGEEQYPCFDLPRLYLEAIWVILLP